MTAPTVWPYGIEGGYHDSSCRCERHCRNCFEDLDHVRMVRDRLIAKGVYTLADQLHPRERYCSPYCRNRAHRERALDRRLAQGGQT